MQSYRFMSTVLGALASFGLSAAAHGDVGGACGCPPDCGVGYTPQYYGDCSGCDGFLDRVGVRADWLYWRASGDNLQLGSEEYFQQAVGGAAFTQNSHTSYKDPEFKFASGFRLGLVYLWACDGWDTTLNWVHYHSKAKASAHGDIDSSTDAVIVVPDWERLDLAYPTYAKSRWHLSLDLLDLELGRKFYLSRCVTARPHIGLRGARVDQTNRYHANLSTTSPISDDFFRAFGSRSHYGSDFLGLGIRAGLDLDFKLGCGWSIFGQVAGSLVCGKQKVTGHEEFAGFPGTSSSEVFENYDQSHRSRRTRAMTDLALGVKWEDCMCWCGSSHPVGVALIWEQHAFFAFNQFRLNTVLPQQTGTFGVQKSRQQNADLTTGGLTLSFTFGF